MLIQIQVQECLRNEYGMRQCPSDFFPIRKQFSHVNNKNVHVQSTVKLIDPDGRRAQCQV